MRAYQKLELRTDSYIAPGASAEARQSGPSPAPVLGWTIHNGRFWLDAVGYLGAIYKEYGLISSMGLQPPRCVFSFAPEYNKRLTEETDRFHWVRRRQHAANPPQSDNDSLLNAARENIFTTWGEQYKTRGILIRPAFRQSWISRWRDTMVAMTEQAFAAWRADQVRDVHEDLNRLVHSIAMKAVLGLDDEPRVELLYALEKKAPRENFGTTLLPFDLPGMPFRRLIRTTTQILAMLREIIEEKQGRGGEPTDMLDVWMSARTEQGVGLNQLELVAEAYNLMHHSTTMSALIWTLILVLQHPDVHASLVDELTGALRGEAPAVQDFDKLPLLDYVVKESFRLLPPAAFGHRFTTEPCSFGPYQLPAGVKIIYSAYITHRLPSIYKDPMYFLPQRWEKLKPSLYEYFPFGARNRHCFGSMFATMEIKIILAILLQRFGLQILSGQRIDRMPRRLTLLRPRRGVHMKVSSQNRQFTPGKITGNLLEMVEFE